MSEPTYDVVIATDTRLPGGTTASVAEEVIAQRRMGLRTGVLHVPSSLSVDRRPVAPRIRDLVQVGACELITAGQIATDVLLFRHPRVAAELDESKLPGVRTSTVVMVANQAPGDPGGTIHHYDPEEANRRLASWIGQEPTWAPIGPLVRSNLRTIAPDLPLALDDWVNIIDVRAWATERGAPRHPVRIGRHSRDHALKWPADRETLLAAYPPTTDVRILGGARTPRDLLGGRLPSNWTVYGFDEMPVRRFLNEIDLFVYHHHPDWVEAFGRTIIEALAAGVPAILPQSFQPLFGEHATYAAPSRTSEAIAAIVSDAAHYHERSAAGRAFVESRFSYAAHEARLYALTETSATPRSNRTASVDVHPSTPPASPRSARVLFISSNGAGVGHLMRLMAIARRLPEDVEPVVLTLSQAVNVVQQLGFVVEYLPSRGALDAPHQLWHDLLERRLVQMIDEFDIDAVVFDGTWPYNGMIAALERRPHVRSVWSRRAMWRASITKHRLDLSERFTTILEPGEFARDRDRGPTSSRRDEVTEVGPIMFLRSDEPLDRPSARRRLGLPSDDSRRIALVQLGAGNINDTSSLLGDVVATLRGADPDLLVCVTRSAIANQDDLPEGVTAISMYPLAMSFAAFDMAVAASGYNTFHELLAAGVATALIPNLETATDDQLARSRWADSEGFAVNIEDPNSEALDEGLNRLVRTAPALSQRLRSRLNVEDGAAQAAATITALLREQDGTRSAASPSREPISVGSGTSATQSRPTPHQLAYLVARWAYRRLPDTGRRWLRRVSGRMTSRPGRLLPAAQPIPLPPGAGADDSTRADEVQPVLIDVPTGLDRQTVHDWLGKISGMQRMTGTFSPLFVTRDTDLQPFRTYGYGVEIMPDREVLRRALGDVAAVRYERERIAEIRASYGIGLVIGGDIDHVLMHLASL